MSKIEYAPIDETKTSVVVDGVHKYFEVGSDINLRIDGNLVRSDCSSVDPEPGDICDCKSKLTKRKCGISKAGKEIGIKRRSDEKQFVVTVSHLTGFNDIKDAFKNNKLDTDKYVTFSQKFINSGIENHCKFSKALIENHPFKFYGIVYNVNDIGVMDEISPDLTTKFLTQDNKFIEYFSDEEFKTQDKDNPKIYGLPYHDYSNNYTTVSANLSANTEWTAGTYYLTDKIFINAYTLTLNAVGGNIIVKTDGVADYLALNNALSAVVTSNTSATNKVYFTSKNDDTKGETIIGSSGTPAKGDQDTAYIYNQNSAGGDITLNYVEFWYAESVTGVVSLGHSADQTGNDFTLNHITLKYCGLPSGLSYVASLIGIYRYFNAAGDLSIQNVSIDNTNTIKDSSNGYGILIAEPQNLTLQNIYVDINTSDQGRRGVLVADIGTNTTINVKNIYVGGDYADECFLLYNTAATNIVVNIYQCIFNSSGNDSFKLNRVAGSFTANVYNNVFMNASTAGKYGCIKGGTITFNESNNGYYNNTANASGFTPTSPVLTDPQLGNLLGGVIATGYFLPDGFAVRNLNDYEKKGSGTFDALLIDETLYSMTGYRYAGTDKVTPGVYYQMASFIAGGGLFFFFDD